MAEIVGVHGIHGVVKLKVFTEDPQSLLRYAPLFDSKKRMFEIEELSQHQTIFLARIKGVDDRTAAEKLRGVKLHVTRDQLPSIEDNDTYYHTDLIGLAVKDTHGTLLGRVQNVNDFGAGTLLEIMPTETRQSFLLPFTNACVPHVDVNAKEMTVIIPEGLL